MKGQAYNPYLPPWEYVPDGEPRVFGDRLYVFGSHDVAGGHRLLPGGLCGLVRAAVGFERLAL